MLKLDAETLVICKQSWVTRYPARFHPTIDWDWQRELPDAYLMGDHL